MGYIWKRIKDVFGITDEKIYKCGVNSHKERLIPISQSYKQNVYNQGWSDGELLPEQIMSMCDHTLHQKHYHQYIWQSEGAKYNSLRRCCYEYNWILHSLSLNCNSKGQYAWSGNTDVPVWQHHVIMSVRTDLKVLLHGLYDTGHAWTKMKNKREKVYALHVCKVSFFSLILLDGYMCHLEYWNKICM